MAKPKGKGWVQIGCVGVDSGQLVITDPAYIDSEWEKEPFKWKKDGDEKEGDVAKKSFSYNACSQLTLKKDAGQLKYKAGHAGVAVAFRAGIGDGLYPVYALLKNVKGFGVRIVEVRIDLLEHPLISGAKYDELLKRNEDIKT